MKKTRKIMTGSIFMLLALLLASITVFAAPQGENRGGKITEITTSEREIVLDFSGENNIAIEVGQEISRYLLQRATTEEERNSGIILEIVENTEMLGDYAPIEAYLNKGDVYLTTPMNPAKLYFQVKGILKDRPHEAHILTQKIKIQEPNQRCATINGKIVFPPEYYGGYIMEEKATVIAVRKGAPKCSEQNAPGNVGKKYFITKTDEEDKFSLNVPEGEYYIQFNNVDLQLDAVLGGEENPTIFNVKCDDVVSVPDIPVQDYLPESTRGEGYIRGSFTVENSSDVKDVKIYAVPTTRNPLYYTRPGIRFDAEKYLGSNNKGSWVILAPKGEFQVLAEFRGTVIKNPGYIMYVYYGNAGHSVFHFDFGNITPVISHKITGNIKNGDAAVRGFVTLIKKPEIENADFKFFNCPTDNEGTFSFTNLQAGNYMLFAVPLQGSYMPGFYREGNVASSIWEEATEINIPSEANESITKNCIVQLATIGANNGSGKIAGKVAANIANGKVVAGVTADNETIEKAIMSVYDMQGKPVRAGETDKNGKFSFENLLPGTYKVSASMYGYKSLTQNITIGENENDRDFSGALFVLEKAMSDVQDAKAEVSVYPNPAKAMINIDFQAQAGNATISISDALGNMVFSNNIATTDGANNYKYNTQSMPNGLYVITITLDNGKTISSLLNIVK